MCINQKLEIVTVAERSLSEEKATVAPAPKLDHTLFFTFRNTD